MGKRRTFLVIVVIVLGLFACTDFHQTESCATQQRMITEAVDFDVESDIVRAMEAAGALQVVQKFEFKDDKLAEELKKGAVRIADLRVEDGFLKFRTTGFDPWLSLPPVNIPAEEINVVTVRAAISSSVNRPEDRLSILFATEGNPRFRKALGADVQVDGKLKTILLLTDAAHVSGWRGTITKLRLDPVNLPDQQVNIQEISFLKITKDVDFSALDIQPQGVGRTWTGPFLQNVVFSHFSNPVEWPLSLPCKPVFHAQVALPSVYRYLDWRPLRALLEVKGETGTWITAARLSLDSSDKDKVFQGVALKASLDKWAGQRVTVRLRVVEDGSGPAGEGLVYWVNPYVTSRRRVEKKPNVILISIDTLRADHLSLYGYPGKTSPNLDSWAHKGVVFQNAFSHSPWTLPSHSSMFTSLFPSQHQAIYTVHEREHSFEGNRLSDSFVTIAEKMREDGYITAGFAGGAFVSWQVNLDQGFDLWHQPFRFGRDLSKVLEWLDDNEYARFFLFLHTYEVHGYNLDNKPTPLFPEYKGKALDKGFKFTDHFSWKDYNKIKDLDDEDIRFFKAKYDERIHALDNALNGFFEKVFSEGIIKNSVIIVTSDHGEEFNEHGGVNHDHSIYDELIHVPLIVLYKDRFSYGLKVHQKVGLVDVYPTILDMVNLPVPEGIEGRSFMSFLSGKMDERERTVFSEDPRRKLSGVRTSTSKYIYRRGERLTFNLAKDPLEKHPDSPPPDIKRLEALHDLFTAKNGGYHFLAKDPRLDACLIRFIIEGRFMNVIPRLQESGDRLELSDDGREIRLTLDLKDGDADGLYFLASPDSAPVKVELCRGDGRALDGLAVSFGSNGTRNVGSSWTLGKDIGWKEIRVRNSPVVPNGDFPGGIALWKLETRPDGGEAASALTEKQKNEHMRRLRSLGYVQ